MRKLDEDEKAHLQRTSENRAKRRQIERQARATRRRLGLSYYEIRELGGTAIPENSARIHCPPILSLRPSEAVGTISFFNAIHDAALTQRKRLLLNFRDCTTLSPEIVPLLVAEVQRIKHFNGGGTVTSLSPRSAPANHSLSIIQRRWDIGLTRPVEIDKDSVSSLFDIRTGVSLDRDVSDVIAEEFSRKLGLDDDRTNDVLIALNEALENISEHAYITALPLAYRAERGRWWVSWIADKSEAYLLACDFGVTIPRTVPLTAKTRGDFNMNALTKFLSNRRKVASDENLLAAAFDENVTRRPDGRGGRGLGRMARIVRGVENGHLIVISGQASAYLSTEEPDVQTRLLHVPFYGTHVIWHLGRLRESEQ